PIKVPITPPAPTPVAPHPLAEAPRTEALPRLPSRSEQARLDADLDRQELAAAFGAVASPPPAAGSVEPRFTAIARALIGVKPLAWSQQVPVLHKERIAQLAERAGSLEGRAARIKEVLDASDSRRARTVVGFDRAARSLEQAAFQASVAQQLAKLAP